MQGCNLLSALILAETYQVLKLDRVRHEMEAAINNEIKGGKEKMEGILSHISLLFRG